MKHTKGPWMPAEAVPSRKDGRACIGIFDDRRTRDTGGYLADVYAGHVGSEDITPDEAWANAHLIASAPDLAEALDKALGTGFVLCNLREADGHDVTEARERLAACYPALAKARGES